MLTHSSAQANILSYTDIPTTYTSDNVITKAGATVTLGPFNNLPPTLGTGSDAVDAAQNPPFRVHYEHKEALVAVEKLKRSIEVSHWGGNVNVQDEMELVNVGPK
jgi:oligosaccharyltransferase complex subunit alpha (ribophorin I)